MIFETAEDVVALHDDDDPPGLHLLLAALLTDELGLLSFISSLKMEDFPFLMIASFVQQNWVLLFILLCLVLNSEFWLL